MTPDQQPLVASATPEKPRMPDAWLNPDDRDIDGTER